jgi:hypothetical protein
MMDIEIVRDVIIALNIESGKIWAPFVHVAKECATK